MKKKRIGPLSHLLFEVLQDIAQHDVSFDSEYDPKEEQYSGIIKNRKSFKVIYKTVPGFKDQHSALLFCTTLAKFAAKDYIAML